MTAAAASATQACPNPSGRAARGSGPTARGGLRAHTHDVVRCTQHSMTDENKTAILQNTGECCQPHVCMFRARVGGSGDERERETRAQKGERPDRHAG